MQCFHVVLSLNALLGRLLAFNINLDIPEHLVPLSSLLLFTAFGLHGDWIQQSKGPINE